ncbi:MAG TPA: glycosyltransferase family 39 protein [Thermoanaerobaculia bacterium]
MLKPCSPRFLAPLPARGGATSASATLPAAGRRSACRSFAAFVGGRRGAGSAGRRAARSRRAGDPGPREDSPLNLVWGLAALAAAGLLFGYAWRAWRRGRPEAAAAAIVAAGLVLRMYAGCDLFLHTWDERYHALVAKHLVEHPLVPALYDHPVLPYDYRDWRSNHVWLHKPPLALWLMAAGMRLLGPDEIAMRLPSLLLSALAILLTYVIGSHLGGRRVGLPAAAFQAVNGYLLQLPGGRVAVDHVDNALIFFVELAILGAVLQVRGWRRGPATELGTEPGTAGGTGGWPAFLLATLAIGAVCGLAVLTKWLPGLLPIPVWLALAWRRQPPRRLAAGLLAMTAACAAVALPWQLYTRAAFPLEARWESAYNLHHLAVPIEGLGGSPLYYLAKMPRFFGELIYLPLGWFLVSLVYPAWRRSRRSLPSRRAGTPQPGGEAAPEGGQALELLPVAVWLLLPLVAFSLAATKLGGYIMIAAPALFIVEASFWLWLWDRRPRRGGARDARDARRVAAAALRWAALVLLPLLPLRYTVERMKIRPSYDRTPPWVRALRELPAQLGPGPVVLFHLDRPLEAMFYTPYIAYEGVPTPAQARHLLAAGYRVVVLDAAAAPPDLYRLPGVEMRREAIPLSPLDDGTGFRLLRPDGSDSPLAGTTANGAAPSASSEPRPGGRMP